MKNIYGVFAALICFLFLSACSENNNQSLEKQMPEILEVEILVSQEIASNEETVLKVQVTQGKESVEDAEAVKFEIWKTNEKQNSKSLLAEHQGDGVYSVQKVFNESGTYYLQTHITARDMHTMPIKELVVENVSEEKVTKTEEEP